VSKPLPDPIPLKIEFPIGFSTVPLAEIVKVTSTVPEAPKFMSGRGRTGSTAFTTVGARLAAGADSA